MLNENIVISEEELNAGTNQVKTIDTAYKPKSINVINSTTAQFSFAVFTESEYQAWLLDPTITDFFMVFQGEMRTVNDLDKFTTTLVVLGTQQADEAHEGSVTFEVMK